MKTTEPDKTKYQTHKYAGNGLVVIADVPNHPKYCYVSNIYVGPLPKGGWTVSSQFFVAHKDVLRTETELADLRDLKGPLQDRMIPDEALTVLHALREKLFSGTHKIVNTRLVEVK